MRARIWVPLTAAVAVAIATAVLAVSIFSRTAPQPRTEGNHTVRAVERGIGRSAAMIVTDPFAAGSKLRQVEYHLIDGYTKKVIIPGGAFVAAEDIAICGAAGVRYPDNGFVGTGLPCGPMLHATEVRYHQHTGDLAGRFRPRRSLEVTEVCQGLGRYLTFGHIDHGALLSVEYYWVNGEHLTVDLAGDVLVDRIELVTNGGRLAAVVTKHG